MLPTHTPASAKRVATLSKDLHFYSGHQSACLPDWTNPGPIEFTNGVEQSNGLPVYGAGTVVPMVVLRELDGLASAAALDTSVEIDLTCSICLALFEHAIQTKFPASGQSLRPPASASVHKARAGFTWAISSDLP